MRGGLHKTVGIKNVSGSCLIGGTINSAFNSHPLLTKFYNFAKYDISLSMTFIELINACSSYEGVDSIFKILTSAAAHDYVKGIPIDIRKFIFFVSKLNDRTLHRRIGKKRIAEILQEGFEEFGETEMIGFDKFILDTMTFTRRLDITTNIAASLHTRLKSTLNYYVDYYVVLETEEYEFQNIYNLETDEFAVIQDMTRAALTSTGEYLCTDMLLYTGENFTHVVYYNLLDGRLMDNDYVAVTKLSSLIPSKIHNSLSEFVADMGTDDVYVPFILHYQKIDNEPRKLGMCGNMKEYESHVKERKAFIIQQLLTYHEG